jgi:hypothetical protein
MKGFIVALLTGLVLTGSAMTTAQAATTPPPTLISLGVNAPAETCSFGVTVDGTNYSMAGTFKLNVSASGKVLFQCRGDLITPAPSQGLVINSDRSVGFVCYDGSGFVPTNDWTFVITPSGKAKYSCHA